MRTSEAWSRPVRTGIEQTTFESIDEQVAAVARSFGAAEMRFPALIDRGSLSQAGYPEAFPHLLLTASRYADQPMSGHPDERHEIDPASWCLSPAVCYHAYVLKAGSRLHSPVVMTARGSCFRAEAQTAPGVRQIEFEMREIVFLGPGPWVEAMSAAAAERLATLAVDLGLEGQWTAAEDPFFLPVAAGKALMQRLLGLKQEYRLGGAEGVALMSINRHGTFFGDRFDIRDARDGAAVHTACVAVGLDRWHAHALSVVEMRGLHVEQPASAE